MNAATLQSLGTEVRIADLEKMLHQLWEANGAEARASLINFVIQTGDASRIAENVAHVSGITLEHACRAILVAAPRAGSFDEAIPEARAWITAHCTLDREGKKFACSDQIAFLVAGDDPALGRSLILSHLDSDLPLVVWWQNDLAAGIDDETLSCVDRLVFDSTEWPRPAGGYRKLVAYSAMPRMRFVPHDLAWTRSHPVRMAFASAFDDPQLGARLPDARELEIRIEQSITTTALLLLSWVVVQAGWQRADGEKIVAESDRITIPYRNHGQAAVATILFDHGCAPIAALRFGGEGFSLEITRQGGARLLHRRIKADGREDEHVLPAEDDSKDGLVTKVLSRAGHNRLFRKFLEPLLELLDELPDQE